MTKSDLNEKSKELSNQQETLSKGSSETYTQSSSSTQKGSISDSAKPAQAKPIDHSFVEWFVGFSEGDGSFVVNNLSNRISFIITQKCPSVLYYIKKELGFGKVYTCKDGYSRYVVSNKKNIESLINVFNGRLKLGKNIARYIAWQEAYLKYYNLSISLDLKTPNPKIDLKSAWLSGFIDAEGLFDAPQRSSRNTFRMRFSLKHKYENLFLSQLPGIWSKDIKIGYLTSSGDLLIYTLDSLIDLRYLMKYLSEYPLRSNKRIAYEKWKKLYRVIEEGGRGKDYEQIKTMAQNINKYEDEDKVQFLYKRYFI